MPASASSADRNLLFGILAVQMNFISKEALIKAMHAWVLDKQKPIGQILLDQKALPADTHLLLDALVHKHLEAHGGDAEKSLAAVSSVGSIRDELRHIADPAVQASLACVSRHNAAEADPFGTQGGTLAAPAGMRFRILRPHARGGLGEVFVAKDEEVRREVALKEIQTRHADNPESRARFLQEAEITGGLEHPGIVPVYGLGQYADGRPFYAMRFIRGDSLKEAIERFHQADGGPRKRGERALELRDLIGRFIDVCNAIGYAHSRGVLHRDLKPGNIMLGKYGETLVVDWGLAKPLGQQEDRQASDELPVEPSKASGSFDTMAGSAVGTPQYMSPEQAAGRLDQLGPASDVYSLGATLYCLLTGKPPFVDKDIGTVLQKVRRSDFPLPRQVKRTVPAALEAICLKAMALKPQYRYASPQALADDIEHWLADEPVTAYREPVPQRLARWARRHQALVAGVGALLLTGLVAVSLSYGLLSHEQEKTTRAQRDRALAQVDALLDVSPEAVPHILQGLEFFRDIVNARLRELRDQPDLSQPRRTRVSLALLPVDAGEVAYLRKRLVRAEPEELLLIRTALMPHREQLTVGLWTLVTDSQADPDQRFRGVVVLAAFDPENAHWNNAGEKIVTRFLGSNPLHLHTWMKALRPVRRPLIEPLCKVYRDRDQPELRRAAATVLIDYGADDPDLLTELLTEADAASYALLWPGIQAHPQRAIARLTKELDAPMPAEDQVVARDALAQRQAIAAVALLQLGQAERVWPMLRHTADPTRRSYLLHLLGRLGAPPEPLLRRLETETDVSARRAIILSLGEYTETRLPAARRTPLVETLLHWYRDDPDPGIHAAVDWLLRHNKQGPAPRKLDWGQAAALDRIDREVRGQPPGERRWFVTREGLTMTIVPGPVEFRMGSPAHEVGRLEKNEDQVLKRIPRSFAVASKYVTVAQFRRFLEANPKVKAQHSYTAKYSPDDSGPIISVTWFEAAQYCNWLSAQEGIAEDQWCYPAIDEIKTGMDLPKDYLQRTGYRLPTEAEWEFVCRAGAGTSFSYGSTETLLSEYAWYRKNSLDRTWPVGQLKPNDLGLFDVHGNVWNWCQCRFLEYKAGDDVEDPDCKVIGIASRSQRGAAFNLGATFARCADRNGNRPSNRSDGVGFLAARTCR